MSAFSRENFTHQMNELRAELAAMETQLTKFAHEIRKIEDARMRLGKVLQYIYDGVSILDKEKSQWNWSCSDRTRTTWKSHTWR